MTIDTSISIFRWAIADKIKQRADNLKNVISSTNVTKYSGLTDSMAYYVSDSISGDTLASELFQVLFYHNSVLKSIKRFNSGADSCYCTAYVGYVAGLSTFHCNQDIIVDVSDFKDYLEDSINLIRRYKVEYLIDYLDNYTGDQISFQEIFTKIYQESEGYFVYPIFTPFPCPWLSGGACGCCGNYHGPCIMCAIICHMHDYICWKSNCKPKYVCFKGCKPTPCW